MPLSTSPTTSVTRSLTIDEPTATGFRKTKFRAVIRKIHGDEHLEFAKRQFDLSARNAQIKSKEEAKQVITAEEMDEFYALVDSDAEVVMDYVEDILDIVGPDGEKVECTPELIKMYSGISYIAKPLALECLAVQNDSPATNGTIKN